MNPKDDESLSMVEITPPRTTGTVDDNDDPAQERRDENEVPIRERSDRTETPEEFEDGQSTDALKP